MDILRERTVRLETPNANGNGHAAEGSVIIAAVGVFREAEPGHTVRETLAGVGVPGPAPGQALRVNQEELQANDMDRVLRPGDKVTIVNRVVGG